MEDGQEGAVGDDQRRRRRRFLAAKEVHARSNAPRKTAEAYYLGVDERDSINLVLLWVCYI